MSLPLKLPSISPKSTPFGIDFLSSPLQKPQQKQKQSRSTIQMLQTLKQKIDEQKKEIDNRNITINNFQKNLQSLSNLVKNQKISSSQLNSQIQLLKLNSMSNLEKYHQLTQQYHLLENQNLSIKQQLAFASKSHNQHYQSSKQSIIYKNKIHELQFIINKLSKKLQILTQQKNKIQKQYNKYLNQYQLSQICIHNLQQQLKKSYNHINFINNKIKVLEEQFKDNKSKKGIDQKKVQELQKKIKQEDNNKQIIKKQLDLCQKKLKLHQNNNNKIDQNITYSDIQSQTQKQQIPTNPNYLQHLQTKCKQLSTQLTTLSQQNQALKVTQSQQNQLKIQLNKLTTQLKQKQFKIQQQQHNYHQLLIQFNLSKQKISSLSNSNLQYQNQLHNHSSYLQQHPKITSPQKHSQLTTKTHQKIPPPPTNPQQIQNIKTTQQQNKKLKKLLEQITKNITTLQKQSIQLTISNTNYKNQINLNNQIIQQKNQYIQNLQQQLISFKSISNKSIKLTQQKIYLQQQPHKINQQIILSKSKLQKKIKQHKQKLSNYQYLLQQSKLQQQKYKKIIANYQQQLKNTTIIKQSQINNLLKKKQSQLDKQKYNNKLLWIDNKKIKDSQIKIKQQTNQKIISILYQKQQQINKLKLQFNKKYNQQHYSNKQFKKILLEKIQQIKIITQHHNKLKSQLTSSKNKIKQLQILLHANQKNYQTSLSTLQTQCQTHQTLITSLKKKFLQINHDKQQIQSKFQSDLHQLNQQFNTYKIKKQQVNIQDKLSLFQKVISELQSAIKAITNSFNCNYCLSPVKTCIRLKQCNHIYCKKCRTGYQPICQQCKKSSQQLPDKSIDNTISKSQYMTILLNTVKQDLSKVNL